MSAGAPTPWKPVVQYERSVTCPKGCGYMAVETWREGAGHGTGVCTKCGGFWRSEGPSPEEAPAPPPFRYPVMSAEEAAAEAQRKAEREGRAEP